MKSASDSILRRIRAKQHGWVFTPKDFIDLATRNTVGIILHRLVKKGLIRKLGHGLYDFPAKHPKLGTLAATPDAIANAIAARSGDVIQPSGAQLANQLGFDTQVPAKPSYITSGNSTRKKIANYPITLSHSKFLNKTSLNINVIKVINALHHLGKNNINDDIVKKCKKILSKKDKSQLKKNLAQLPDWMIQFILKIIGN
jgi:predicted transcriptional regulator of viral defense system